MPPIAVPDLTKCDCADRLEHVCVTSPEAEAYHLAAVVLGEVDEAGNPLHVGGCWCCCWECPFDVTAIYERDESLGVESV